MCKRLYTFINNNNVIYNLRFGFRQYTTYAQYTKSHVLINIIENQRKALVDRNKGCRGFTDLQ